MNDDLICPYCGYNFYEDKPDLSWLTEKYMIDNNIPVPESPAVIFDEATEYNDQPATEAEVTCYKCDKKFIAYRNMGYSSKKIEEEKDV